MSDVDPSSASDKDVVPEAGFYSAAPIEPTAPRAIELNYRGAPGDTEEEELEASPATRMWSYVAVGIAIVAGLVALTVVGAALFMVARALF